MIKTSKTCAWKESNPCNLAAWLWRWKSWEEPQTYSITFKDGVPRHTHSFLRAAHELHEYADICWLLQFHAMDTLWCILFLFGNLHDNWFREILCSKRKCSTHLKDDLPNQGLHLESNGLGDARECVLEVSHNFQVLKYKFGVPVKDFESREPLNLMVYNGLHSFSHQN
jgi:hypothetical protein